MTSIFSIFDMYERFNNCINDYKLRGLKYDKEIITIGMKLLPTRFYFIKILYHTDIDRFMSKYLEFLNDDTNQQIIFDFAEGKIKYKHWKEIMQTSDLELNYHIFKEIKAYSLFPFEYGTCNYYFSSGGNGMHWFILINENNDPKSYPTLCLYKIVL